jgi:uncharacterized protein YndB with AHSA1/START domain
MPKFVYVTYIDTTPEKLWKSLTTTELIRQYWSGRTNESKWRKGAVLESRSPDGELEWHGKIVETKRFRTLSYTFKVVGTREEASHVIFDIERPKRTDSHQSRAIRLTVTHEGFAAKSKVYEGVKEGWPTILSSLKSLLETGRAIRFTYRS